MKHTENGTITTPSVFNRATFSSKVIIVLEGGSVVKNPSTKAGDTRDAGLIPGSGRSPGVGNGKPLQCSCLANPMDKRSLEGYSPWGHRVRHDSATNTYFFNFHIPGTV